MIWILVKSSVFQPWCSCVQPCQHMPLVGIEVSCLKSHSRFIYDFFQAFSLRSFYAQWVGGLEILYFWALRLTFSPYVWISSCICPSSYSPVKALCCWVCAYISDKTRRRALLIAIQTVFTIIGLVITAYAKPSGVRYFGMCLLTNLTPSSQFITRSLRCKRRSFSLRSCCSCICWCFGASHENFTHFAFRTQTMSFHIPSDLSPPL